LQARGAIYHHTQLVFHNGFIGKKYIILLNSPAKKDPYLFGKLKLISEKIQIYQKKGRQLFLYMIPKTEPF